MVQVRIDQPEYSTAEDLSPVTVCATLIDANIERNLVVALSTSDDTAQGEVSNLIYCWYFMRQFYLQLVKTTHPSLDL